MPKVTQPDSHPGLSSSRGRRSFQGLVLLPRICPLPRPTLTSLPLPPASRRLSGLSPFLGADDTETLNNVLSGNWYFDEETFEAVSDEAKDFVSNLIVKDQR